jgi:hypothetical protein
MARRRNKRVEDQPGMTVARMLAGGLVLSLGGCASLGEPDELQQKLERYYAGAASEEDGACPTPEIASITHRKVLASSGERTRLRVRYSYFDPSREGDASWQQVLLADRPCTGFAEREFMLERGTLGYQVVEMSGERRAP